VLLWDVATGQEQYQLPGHFQTRAINWVNSERLLTLGGTDQLVRVWDVAARQQLALLGSYGVTGEIRTAVWSPDNTHLAVLGSDDVVRIWDASSGAVVQALVGHIIRGPRIGGGNGYQPVNDVIWSPDGRFLATAGTDETIRVWDAATGQEQYVLQEAAPVRALAWANQGNFLAAATSDEWDEAGHIRVWNLSTRSELWRRSHPMIRVSDLAFSLDDTKLAVGGWSGSGGIEVRDATSGSSLSFLQLAARRLDVARFLWTPDNARIITAVRDAGEIQVWNATVFDGSSRSLDFLVSGVDTRSLWDMEILPDGVTLITLGYAGNLRIWQPDSDNRILEAELALPPEVATGHFEGRRSLFQGRRSYLALSPNGQRLAVLASDGQTIQIFMIAP
jgi:WD40 repeat protein